MKIYILVLALVINISYCHQLKVLGLETRGSVHSGMPGGWQQIKCKTQEQLFDLPLFAEADYLAFEDFYKQFQVQLQVIQEVFKQVVNGINYKIIYQTPCGLVFYIIYADLTDESVTIIDKGNLPIQINDHHL